MSHKQLEEILARTEKCIEKGETLKALLLLDEAAPISSGDDSYQFLMETAIEEADDLAHIAAQIDYPSAVGAEIKAFEGLYDEAYEELAEFALASKSSNLLTRVKGWSEKKNFWDELTKERAKRLFIRTIGRFGGRHQDELRAVFRALEPIVQHIVATSGDDFELLFYCSSILREGGLFQEALNIAEKTHEQNPSWQMAVNLAYARRDKGDIEGARAAFKEAEELEPNDDVQVDLAAMLFDNGRDEEAFSILDKVLTRRPDHFCAYPLYCREMCLRKGDEQKFMDLREFASKHGRGTQAFAHAQSCLKAMVGAGPLIRYLPPAEDVSIKLLVSVLPETKEKVTITASTEEAPSVYLALKLATESRDFSLNYSQIQGETWTPNPLARRRPGEDVLWTFGNGKRELLVGTPDILVCEMVYSVASGPYHIDEWWDLCNTVARDIGPRAVNDLLGTMVHFDSQMPFPRPAWNWIQSVQVASAMTLAQLEPQWDCPSKNALLAVAEGPVDWVVNGAIVALLQLAKTQPDWRDRIAEIFQHLQEDAKHWSWCCYQRWITLASKELEALR